MSAARWTVAVALLATGSASAQQAGFAPFKMTQNSYVYVVYSPPGGLTPAGPIAAVTQDVRDAFDPWNNNPPSYATWTFGGTTTSMGTHEDLVSVAPLFITSTADPYYQLALGGGTRRSGSIPLTYAGQLYACDIYLEAVPGGTAWMTGTLLGPTTASVTTYVGHEAGHCMSLTDDVPDMAALMSGTAWASQLTKGPLGERRIPNAGDYLRQAQRYPNGNQLLPGTTQIAGSVVGTPCDGQDFSPLGACPGSGFSCLQITTGADQYGAGWRAMCSAPCTVGNPGNCPVPYACVASAAFAAQGFNGACLPNAGNDVAQIGKECTAQGDCKSPLGICDVEGTLPSTFPMNWGGYCTQNCSPPPGGQPCPGGSLCMQEGAGVFRCRKTCRIGMGDCRDKVDSGIPEYACAQFPGVPDGICTSACRADGDCVGTNAHCRTCDGLCWASNKPTGLIGDLCTTNADCGNAQVCYTGFKWTTQGVCAQVCGTACSECPNGFKCVPMPFSGGSRYCMRDCVEGTCPAGEQCLDVAGTKGCAPTCTASSCPPGQTCDSTSGQCTPTTPPGPCPLCYSGYLPDGNFVTDGGVNPGIPPGGCGCQSGGMAGAFLLFALWALSMARARRAWPRR